MSDDRSLNMFLPTFLQADAQKLSGADTVSVNNWLARGYIQLSQHPKARAIGGGRMFSFYDVLKLKVMGQLAGLKVPPKFAAEIGNQVVARIDMIAQEKEEAKDPLEILVLSGGKSLYRRPAQNNFDLGDVYIVVSCDRMFYRTFDAVYSTVLSVDFGLIQSAYMRKEQAEIFDEFQAYIWQAKEQLIDGLSMQAIEKEVRDNEHGDT